MTKTEKAVEALNDCDGLDFVIHTGDLADFGMRSEFERQRDILNKLHVPYVTILGNHDCLATGETIFRMILRLTRLRIHGRRSPIHLSEHQRTRIRPFGIRTQFPFHRAGTGEFSAQCEKKPSWPCMPNRSPNSSTTTSRKSSSMPSANFPICNAV